MTPDAAALLASLETTLTTGAPASVVSVYLFGSHAEQRAHRESDVDVGVLFDYAQVPTATQRFDEGLRLHALLGPTAGSARLDLVVLNDVPPGLAARVVTSGIRIFCQDQEADHAFRRDVQLRAADLEPFLRRTRAITLEALRR